MFLFFDTETTGLSRTNDRIVQIAWMITDRSGQITEEENYIIKPTGFNIPTAASKIHGITNEKADRTGVPIESALKQFRDHVKNTRVVVAHNLDFDVAIIRCELNRLGMPSDVFDDKFPVCTMKGSKQWCRLPKLNGLGGFKYPKLEELHYKLFGKYFDDAHDALADVDATRKCFFKLFDEEIIVIPEREFAYPENSIRSSAANKSTKDRADFDEETIVIPEREFAYPENSRRSSAANKSTKDRPEEAAHRPNVNESPYLNAVATDRRTVQETLQNQALNNEWIYFTQTATLVHVPSRQRFVRGQWEWNGTGFVLAFGDVRVVSVDKVAYR